jgi:replicative DNA helicase
MGNEEYWERMVAANGVPSDRLRTGNLTTEDFKSMSKTASDLASPPRMTIDDTGELTILEMRTRARRWRARSGAGANALIVIDYLQLVRSGRKGDQPREQEVAEVSRSIKIMAKELKVPVIALAQLNREVEKRQNKRPGIADLRESGQIEQDADIVGFLYREEIADPSCEEAKKGTAELIVAKGRGIPRGTIHLLFDKEHTRFRNRPPRVKTAGQGNTYQEDNDVED